MAQRPTAEVGEADAEHRAHVHLGGAGDDAFLEAAHGFQAQRDHHPCDDFRIAQFERPLAQAGDQCIGLRIGALDQAAGGVRLVAVEALAVLLAKAAGLVHGRHGISE
ncbi:hypothetical protein D3C80_1705080 [compost metagenome]